MIPDSREIIHMGINYVISPAPVINKRIQLDFQNSLLDQGIDFARVAINEQEILVAREAPTSLEIKVIAVPAAPVGQLLVVAPFPNRDLSMFAEEVKAITNAFDSTWPAKNRQIISSDATLRDLYETSGEHAFQELWEIRLGQSSDALNMLGRPVLGGGLRFVMPPQPDDLEPIGIEVKIESFLRDTRKIFVETQFTWQPMPAGAVFDPVKRLNQINQYVEEKVIPFITGGDQR